MPTGILIDLLPHVLVEGFDRSALERLHLFTVVKIDALGLGLGLTVLTETRTPSHRGVIHARVIDVNHLGSAIEGQFRAVEEQLAIGRCIDAAPPGVPAAHPRCGYPLAV